jgi:branched-chain amino acid transport system ATP-binding protein
MMATPEPILRVEALSVRYGALRALSDVSWSVAEGDVLGIIGPNGAGKSTSYEATMNMVPRQGRVFLRGTDISDLPPWELAPLGLRRTFQQNVFFDELSVIDNMASVLVHRFGTPLTVSILNPWLERRRWREAQEMARALLVRFGVPEPFHALRPSSIPYGTQRMLSIALAHSGDAKVILLDEPGAGLGGQDMLRLRNLLVDLRAEGLALVVIEHHMDLIMAVADRIVVLDRGAVLSTGTPQEVRQDPQVLEAYLGRAA